MSGSYFSCPVAVKKSILLLRKETYIISLLVMMDATVTSEPMKGRRFLDTDAVFMSGGLAPKAPNPVPVPVPAGSGFPKLNPGGGDCVPVDPGDDDVVGVGKEVGLTGAWVIGDVGVVEDDDDGKTHEPVLGLLVVTTAAPPKSQLVGTGFFW